MDREAAARAIAEEARRSRVRPSRGLWIAAGIVSALCLGALAIGWFGHGARPAGAHPPPAGVTSAGGGFGLGLMVGLVAGVAIGSLIALRRKPGDD